MNGEKIGNGESQGYPDEPNPWAELERYRYEDEESSEPENDNAIKFGPLEKPGDKYREAIKAAKKALISGGILPAYLSVQAMGLISGGGLEGVVQRGTEVIKAFEDGADKFAKMFSGEWVSYPSFSYGDSLYDFSDDSLNYDDVSEDIYFDENGNVVLTEMIESGEEQLDLPVVRYDKNGLVKKDMIYGQVGDFDGSTMEELADQIFDNMSDEEKADFINGEYAELVAGFEAIKDKIMANEEGEELTTDVLAKKLVAYLVGHCRYAGEVDDPRGLWGNAAEGMDNWNGVLLDQSKKTSEETPDLANKFIIELRDKQGEFGGPSSFLVHEASNALCGGEANCLGMAGAVALGVNYYYSLEHPDEKGAVVAVVASLNMDDGGKHAIVLYKGEDDKWRSIDPTLEVCSRKNLANVLYSSGMTDLGEMGDVVYEQNDFFSEEDLSAYCNAHGATLKDATVITGENSGWRKALESVGLLYENAENAEASEA